MTLLDKINRLTIKKCEVCGKEEDTNLHHIDRNPKNNDLYNLKILCNKCHGQYHSIDKRNRYCRTCLKFFSGTSSQVYCDEGCRRKYHLIIEAGSEEEFKLMTENRRKSRELNMTINKF